jgi:hypothetical protein
MKNRYLLQATDSIEERREPYSKPTLQIASTFLIVQGMQKCSTHLETASGTFSETAAVYEADE